MPPGSPIPWGAGAGPQFTPLCPLCGEDNPLPPFLRPPGSGSSSPRLRAAPTPGSNNKRGGTRGWDEGGAEGGISPAASWSWRGLAPSRAPRGDTSSCPSWLLSKTNATPELSPQPAETSYKTIFPDARNIFLSPVLRHFESILHLRCFRT